MKSSVDEDLLYCSFLALDALGGRYLYLTGLEMTVAEEVNCEKVLSMEISFDEEFCR